MLERGLSPRTIEYTNAVLQSAFRQAVRWKMLAEDPCVGVDLPPLKRQEMDALSVEECRRFLAIARESKWFVLFALVLTTGMRPSEYLALKWSDIDWQRGTSSVSRTLQISASGYHFDDTKRKRSRRIVKLQAFVLQALENLSRLQSPHQSVDKGARELRGWGCGEGAGNRRPIHAVRRGLDGSVTLLAGGIRPPRFYGAKKQTLRTRVRKGARKSVDNCCIVVQVGSSRER
jgi:integrase